MVCLTCKLSPDYDCCQTEPVDSTIALYHILFQTLASCTIVLTSAYKNIQKNLILINKRERQKASMQLENSCVCVSTICPTIFTFNRNIVLHILSEQTNPAFRTTYPEQGLEKTKNGLEPI